MIFFSIKKAMFPLVWSSFLSTTSWSSSFGTCGSWYKYKNGYWYDIHPIFGEKSTMIFHFTMVTCFSLSFDFLNEACGIRSTKWKCLLFKQFDSFVGIRLSHSILTLVPIQSVWPKHLCWTLQAHLCQWSNQHRSYHHYPIPYVESLERWRHNRLISTECHSIVNLQMHTEKKPG